MFSIKQIAGYFFSYQCPSCDSYDYNFMEESFCSDCLHRIGVIEPPYCHGCGAELDGVLDLCSKCMVAEGRPWKDAVTVFHMKGFGGELIHRFKYGGAFELGRSLGQIAAEAVVARGIKVDVIVPIPLHWARMLRRGYNQSEIIATHLSHELNIPVERLIMRNRRTKQQAKLDKSEREKNLMNSFSLIKGANYKKRSILLVDDVMTTGATLTEAAKVLLSELATDVNVLVLARR